MGGEKGHAYKNRLSGGGITPAWAGKSEVSKYAAKPGEDHPRVGGEKLRVALWRLDTLGSPPRGRGKEPDRGKREGYNGITPAWAGKSSGAVFWACR